MPHLDTSSLFRPFSVRLLELKNRIVMAPMTGLFSPEGIPGPASATYYRRRAEGGVGLILSEGTVVDRPASHNDAGIPFFHGDQALAGWKNVIDAVHDAGGRMADETNPHAVSDRTTSRWARRESPPARQVLHDRQQQVDGIG